MLTLWKIACELNEELDEHHCLWKYQDVKLCCWLVSPFECEKLLYMNDKDVGSREEKI